MILRDIAFVLIIIFFAALALFMVADLSNTQKKIDKHSGVKKKKINSKKTLQH